MAGLSGAGLGIEQGWAEPLLFRKKAVIFQRFARSNEIYKMIYLKFRIQNNVCQEVITFDNLPHADIKYVQYGVTGDKSRCRRGILSKNNSILFMRITVQSSVV